MTGQPANSNRLSSEAVYIDDEAETGAPRKNNTQKSVAQQNLNASHNNMMMLV